MVDLHISWEEYNKKTEQLASMVYKDGWDFNQVVCIAKGGMRVGDIMARIFDVPLAVLSVESYRGDGVKNKKKVKNYYVKESVGIATGILISCLHYSGLSMLTHTPSPMNFLNQILKRPNNEKPFVLLVVGKPKDDCEIPIYAEKKKAFNKITSIF